LANEWCEIQGLPPARAKTAMICRGVRHALEAVFGALSVRGERIALPSDAYPVYWQLAENAGVAVDPVTTFPDFDINAILCEATRAGAEWVLLPAPLHLHGRPWDDTEAAIATDWLGENPERRLILDGVYSLGLPARPPVAALIETDQV